jgi:hypothetical protein
MPSPLIRVTATLPCRRWSHPLQGVDGDVDRGDRHVAGARASVENIGTARGLRARAPPRLRRRSRAPANAPSRPLRSWVRVDASPRGQQRFIGGHEQKATFSASADYLQGTSRRPYTPCDGIARWPRPRRPSRSKFPGPAARPCADARLRGSFNSAPAAWAWWPDSVPNCSDASSAISLVKLRINAWSRSAETAAPAPVAIRKRRFSEVKASPACVWCLGLDWRLLGVRFYGHDHLLCFLPNGYYAVVPGLGASGPGRGLPHLQDGAAQPR